MRKVALMVIYNHRFDRNIPLIDKMYKERFTYVYHIVPFYDGTQENVIPVYESSYHFQSYISQAYTHLKNNGFTHYFIVADDMLLNPKVDENTLWEETGLEEDECMYPTDFWYLQKLPWCWSWIDNALHYKVRVKGVEVANILPSVEQAESAFRRHGIPLTKIPFRSIYQGPYKALLSHLPRIPFKRKLAYPLVAGYSDILLLTADIMSDFCKFCGAFAATGLFVETAIPTSLVLSASKIRLDKDLKLHYGALWNKELEEFNGKYNYSLKMLVNDFPKDKLYIHPVKFSKWK